MDRIEHLKQFLITSPSDSFLMHALALEHVKIGNDDEAHKLFEEILTRDPLYIGSYYHFAKLLERAGKNEEAIEWYEKGMDVAKQLVDNHAYNELKGAYEDLTF